MATQLSRPDLKALVQSSFPTTGTKYITAAIMRAFMDDFIESVLIFLSDDSDDVTEGSSNLWKTLTEQQKLAFITVTQAVDLDDVVAKLNALDQAIVMKGEWDASSGSFAGGGTAQAGWAYIVNTAGTVDGVEFAVGDRLIALVDNASTTTYAGNWFKDDGTDNVTSVAGKVGSVLLDANDITEAGDRVWLTNVAQVILGEKSFGSLATFTAHALGSRPVVVLDASAIIAEEHKNRQIFVDVDGGNVVIQIEDSTNSEFAVGDLIELIWFSDTGTNEVSFATGGAQNIVSKDSKLKVSAIGSAVALVKKAENQWWLGGDLSA